MLRWYAELNSLFISWCDINLPQKIKEALKDIVVKAIAKAVNNIAEAEVINDPRLVFRDYEAKQALEAVMLQKFLEASKNEEAVTDFFALNSLKSSIRLAV